MCFCCCCQCVTHFDLASIKSRLFCFRDCQDAKNHVNDLLKAELKALPKHDSTGGILLDLVLNRAKEEYSLFSLETSLLLCKKIKFSIDFSEEICGKIDITWKHYQRYMLSWGLHKENKFSPKYLG